MIKQIQGLSLKASAALLMFTVLFVLLMLFGCSYVGYEEETELSDNDLFLGAMVHKAFWLNRTKTGRCIKHTATYSAPFYIWPTKTHEYVDMKYCEKK